MEAPLYDVRLDVASAHPRGARSACLVGSSHFVTGGQDGSLLVWTAKYDTQGGWAVSEKVPRAHDSPIFALTAISDTTFVSGGKDGLVKMWDLGGRLLRTLGYTQHTAEKLVPVSSLAYDTEDAILCIGSWDGVCRLKNMQNEPSGGAPEGSLVGHRYAVTVAVFRDPEGLVVATGDQSGDVKFWRVKDCSKPFKTFTKHHQDIVRAFASYGDILYSTSNDGNVNEVRLSTAPYTKGASRSLHPSTFVYSIALSPATNPASAPLLATATEEGIVYLWSTESWRIVTQFGLRSTVWQALFLSTGDLLTVDDSGAVMIWTSDSAVFAPEATRAAFCKSIEDRRAAAAKVKDIDVAKLPNAKSGDLLRVKGQRVGEHKLFRSGDMVVVYQWNGHAWEEVGEMVNGGASSAPALAPDLATGDTLHTGGRQYYAGDLHFPQGYYDYVFHVELDGGRSSKLPYNVHDNDILAAEKFCARENINKSLYLTQICQWIAQQTNARKIQLPPPHTPISANPSSPSPAIPLTDASVIHDFILFSATKVDALSQAMRTNNTSVPAELQLTSLEITYLDELLAAINSGLQTFKSKPLRVCELDLVFRTEKLERWGAGKILPLMDLRRIVTLHPDVVEVHKGSDGGWRLVRHALCVTTTPATDKLHAAEIETASKYLANLFSHPTPVHAMSQFLPELLRLLPHRVSGPRTGPTRCALLSVVANLALMSKRRNRPAEASAVLHWLADKADLEKAKQEDDAKALELLLAAVCTAVKGSQQLVATAAEIGAFMLDGRAVEAAPGVEKVCAALLELAP